MTETIHNEGLDILEDLVPYEDTDDGNEHLTHVISPAENTHVQKGVWMEAADIIFSARLEGIEIVALCGYRFVPKRDPEKYPACQKCMDIAHQHYKENG